MKNYLLSLFILTVSGFAQQQMTCVALHADTQPSAYFSATFNSTSSLSNYELLNGNPIEDDNVQVVVSGDYVLATVDSVVGSSTHTVFHLSSVPKINLYLPKDLYNKASFVSILDYSDQYSSGQIKLICSLK